MASHSFSYDDFIRFRNVPRETFLRLEHYIELLKKWQKTINLVSESTLSDVWIRHIIDSVQLVEYVSEGDVIADVGSGAGFPGLVLAILGITPMTLIESDARKMAFLREAARATDTKVEFLNQRVEQVSLREFSVITARAFAPLGDMLDKLSATLKTGAKLLLLKGKTYRSEIEAAQAAWNFEYDTYPSVTEKDAVILSLRNISKRSA